MSQKIDLMNEIVDIDESITADRETETFLQSLDPTLVKSFEVIESDQITLIVKLTDNQQFVNTYTDTTVFEALLVNMIIEIDSNLTAREATKATKEAELKTLLP